MPPCGQSLHMWTSTYAEIAHTVASNHQPPPRPRRRKVRHRRKLSCVRISSFERADSKTSAVLNGQGEWTTVKRKWKGKRQTRRQSEKPAGRDQAKEWPGSAQQQVETEAQPAETLEVIQKTSLPASTPPRRHPSRRQRRKMLRQEQKEMAVVQRQPASKTVDVPAVPAAETLAPRRWKQVKLCTDPPGCSPLGAPLAGPAGCSPTWRPASHHPGSDIHWQSVCSRKSGKEKPQLPSRHRLHP